MRLSDLPRRLPVMRWWGWALAWGAAAVPFGVVVGRTIRAGDRPRYVPQLDAPLWRGTDLDGRRSSNRCTPCLTARSAPHDCTGGMCGCPCRADDGLPSWDPEPPRGSAIARDDVSALGALLHLSTAPDETSARYWLAVYARRGATWEQQREAWDEWQRLHDTSVTYLNTYRPEDPRP